MTTSAVPKWQAKGQWFDVCRCSIPCPCSWAQPPTEGDCEGILLWHITEGSYGDTSLDGLNMAMLGSFTGSVWEGKATNPLAAIFLDERADDAQRAALQAIFGGEAGGWPAQFGEIFRPEMRGMEVAPIEVDIADDLSTWSMRVPGKAEAAAEALTGPASPDGKPVTVNDLPGSEVGPHREPAHWGRATTDRADAFGFAWDRSGRSSKFIPFEWSGPDEA